MRAQEKPTDSLKRSQKQFKANDCRPQGVIATTFTTAAANELKERLAEKLHQSGRHEDAILLDGGMIGTVHSVCLDILTRFALEAGLSPDLTILDESQSEILLSRAFDLTLSDSGHRELYTLSDKLGHYDHRSKTHNWRKDITKIVENARSNDIHPDTFPVHRRGQLEGNARISTRTDRKRPR